MKDHERGALLRTPYKLGGRQLRYGLDCLGVALYVLRCRGTPVPDPWGAIQAAWRADELDTATCFPEGWYRVNDQTLADGDVMLFAGQHDGVAVVDGGFVWGADPRVRTIYCRPVSRWERKPKEVWRHDPRVRP